MEDAAHQAANRACDEYDNEGYQPTSDPRQRPGLVGSATELKKGFREHGLVDILGHRTGKTDFVNGNLSGKVERDLALTKLYHGGQPMSLGCHRLEG